MNPFKRSISNDLIVLWETAVKPDLQAEIEALWGGDEGNAQSMTKREKKEMMQGFLDYAGSRVATLAIMDARGLIAKNTHAKLEPLSKS